MSPTLLNQAKRPGDEITIHGRSYRIVQQFPTGYNSAVYECRNGANGTEVLKIYGERVSLRTENLATFIVQLRDYYWQLKKLGVCLPPCADRIHATQNGSFDSFHVIVVAPFMGDNLELQLQRARDEKDAVNIQRSIFRSLGRLMLNPSKRLTVGIDLVPRNFVGDKATYVDLVPPKIRVGRKYLLEYPDVESKLARQVGIYRHYDRAGVMHVLLVQMARQVPAFMPRYEAEIIRYLKRKKLDTALRHFSNRLTARSITGTSRDIPHIEKLSFSRVYDMREIACWYCHWGLITPNELNKIFSLSHFQNNPLPQRTVNSIKKMLLTAVM